MRLPNGDRAIVDIRKLRDYCLNPDNEKGRHKARVFARVLGLSVRDAEYLRETLLRKAATGEARLGELDLYGQRYTIDFEMMTAGGSAEIRSGWIILHGQATPRFLTCYVRTKKS
jgi:hypothetical protein